MGSKAGTVAGAEHKVIFLGVAAGAEHEIASIGRQQAPSIKLHPWADSRRGARGEAEHELHLWVGSRRRA
jgi:hypothetical protein